MLLILNHPKLREFNNIDDSYIIIDINFIYSDEMIVLIIILMILKNSSAKFLAFN